MKQSFALWMKRLIIRYLKVKGNKGFSILAGINRPIKPAQVEKIAISIKRMGVVRPVIVAKIKFITGKEETFILDGQHLYHACLKLGIDIPYTFIEVTDKKDLVETIALLNSSSKSWTMNDYVVAWSNIYGDYIKLNEWVATYNIEVSVVASIMSGSVGITGGVINRKIKEGTFRVKDEGHNLMLLKQVYDVLAILDKASRFNTKHLCIEYITFVKNCPATGPNRYQHDKFLLSVKKQANAISLALQAESKLVDLFNKIYKNQKQ